jgi:hypothetical protein
MFFEEKDVLHIRTLEPSNHDVGQLIGVGLINAAIENSNIDAEGKAFLQRYYNNDARPPQILRDGDQYFTDSEQWELFKSKWNTELTNNQLRAKIQGEGMKIESLIGSAVNLDFGEVHEINRQAISEVFGLPLDLLNGKLNGKAVTRDIINRYHLNTINPLLELIDAAYTGKEVDFTPEPTHDFIDVEDVVEGIINLSEHSARGVFELGTGIKTTNFEVLELVEKITEKKVKARFIDNLRPYDNKDWVSTNFKSRSYGWLPKKTLEQSITEMVDAYRRGREEN